MNLVRWFAQAWPFPEGRRAVLEQYRVIGGYKLAMADIALRCGVYSADSAAPGDVFGAGVIEGRRRAALEILNICAADPRELYGHIERRPQQREEPSR